jgi:hypothetical protein
MAGSVTRHKGTIPVAVAIDLDFDPEGILIRFQFFFQTEDPTFLPI